MALGLATPLKVRGLAKKRLLRRALAPLLPKEILRAPKQGFSIPVAAWLRGPLQGFARETLSAETLARQGWLDPATVSGLLDRHAQAAGVRRGFPGEASREVFRAGHVPPGDAVSFSRSVRGNEGRYLGAYTTVPGLAPARSVLQEHFPLLCISPALRLLPALPLERKRERDRQLLRDTTSARRVADRD